MKMHAAIRDTIALDSGGDVWGWALGHWFDVAETLHLRGESIPKEWKFRPSPLLSEAEARENWAEAELLDAYDRGEVTGDDLRKAGAVLDRYCAFLKAKGLDY